MAGRQFSVSFRINGSLDGSLQAALQAAANSMRGLGNAARQASASAQASKAGLAGMAAGLNQLQQAAQKYKAVQDALKQSMSDLSKAQQAASSAKAKFDADTAAVEKLKAQLKSLRDAQSRLGVTKSTGNAVLRQLRQDLQGLKRDYDIAKKAGDELKLSQLASQIKTAQSAVQAQQEAVRKAAQAYKELSDKVKQTKADLQAAQTAQNASSKGLSSANSDASRLAASYQRQQAALRSLTASLSSAGFNVSNFAASESRLAADIDRVNAALRQQQALSSAQAASNAASQNMTMAGANFMGAISTAQQIAAPFQSAIDNAMTFEHSMSRVKALTQTGNIMAGNTAQVEAEMAKLEAQARELGSTTQFTMTQAADAMGYLGMAGWKTEQIYGTMPGMLNLAAGAGTDLARTADIVSDNMTAMGVPVEKASHFMDVYAYALTNSNVNLESFGETMKYAAPVAAAFGATLEDTAAMTMMMGNAGIKGSMAGTALRMGLLRLSGPPKKASKALDEMGISVSDATAMAMEAEAELARLGVQYDKNAPPMNKMQSIITQLSGKMANMTAEEKLASVSAIFGANAASGWINILEQGPEVFNKYLAALQDCDGYSEQFAHTMNDDTRGAMIALESAMDAVQNSIGTALLPAVRAAAEAFTPIASAIAIFIQEHPGVVQAAAAIAAALTTIVVGAAAVKLAFAGWGFITSTVTLVQTALASLGSGAVLSGLISRLTFLRTLLVGTATMSGFATFGGWKTLFVTISTQAAIAAASVKSFFASLTLGSMASGVVSTLTKIGTAIRGAAMAAMSFAFSPVGVALMALALAGLYCYQNWEKVGPALSQVAGIISGALSPAILTVQAAASTLGNVFDRIGASSGLSELASLVGGTLIQAFVALAGAAATAIGVIVRGFADLIKTVVDFGTGIFDAVSKISDGDFSGAFESLKFTASRTADNIKNTFNHAFNGVKEGVEATKAAIETVKMDRVSVDTSLLKNDVASSPISAAVAQIPQAPPVPEQQPIDTSATQAALDQVGSSAQNASTNMDAINQATQNLSQVGNNVQQAGTSVQTFGTNAQNAGTGVQQLSTNATTAGTGVQNLGTNAQTAGGGVSSLGEAANGATGGTSALGSAAGGASGSVGGLGAAAQSACAQLMAAAAAGGAKANYRGGIYKKGAFLTTFAEKSPEAAIPIDNSKRAVDLWTQTGQMLGQLPGDSGGYDSAPKDALGNLTGVDVPEYNRINEGDTIAVKRAKADAQRKQFAAQKLAAQYTAQQISQAVSSTAKATTQATTQAVTQAATSTDYAKLVTDELGNIKGLDVPEYNRINEGDTVAVKRAKADAQRKQFDAQRQALQSTAAVQSSVQPQVQTPSPALTRMSSRMSAASERRLRTQLQVQQPLLESRRGTLEGLTNNLSQPISQATSEPKFTINVTVNGNADADEVKRGVEQAIPQLESFARQLDIFKHEAARRSFA